MLQCTSGNRQKCANMFSTNACVNLSDSKCKIKVPFEKLLQKHLLLCFYVHLFIHLSMLPIQNLYIINSVLFLTFEWVAENEIKKNDPCNAYKMSLQHAPIVNVLKQRKELHVMFTSYVVLMLNLFVLDTLY